MQSVSITTNVVSSNPAQTRCTWYNITCDKVCQWLTAGPWFSPCTPVLANKIDRHDITEVLLKVALNTITLTHKDIRYTSDSEHPTAATIATSRSNIEPRKFHTECNLSTNWAKYYLHQINQPRILTYNIISEWSD
jgi:hypothetical protein